MKVLVVGAGGQGGPCASILAHDGAVQEIRLGAVFCGGSLSKGV